MNRKRILKIEADKYIGRMNESENIKNLICISS